MGDSLKVFSLRALAVWGGNWLLQWLFKQRMEKRIKSETDSNGKRSVGDSDRQNRGRKEGKVTAGVPILRSMNLSQRCRCSVSWTYRKGADALFWITLLRGLIAEVPILCFYGSLQELISWRANSLLLDLRMTEADSNG